MSTANKFTYYATNENGGRVYFTGFNEEGFSVSPRGIEDIQTGEVLASEEIDAPDVPLDIPTFFDQLNANTLTVNQELVINGQVSGTPNWGNTLPNATASQRGIVEMATVQEAAAGTDNERAVTPLGFTGALTTAINAIDQVPTGVIQWFAERLRRGLRVGWYVTGLLYRTAKEQSTTWAARTTTPLIMLHCRSTGLTAQMAPTVAFPICRAPLFEAGLIRTLQHTTKLPTLTPTVQEVAGKQMRLKSRSHCHINSPQSLS